MSDPLLALMKKLRRKYGRSQAQLAACMGIAEDTYRHIEKGRRPLPDIRHGFVDWIKTFLHCVGASKAEERELIELATRLTLEEFSHLLDEQSPDQAQPP